MPDGVYAEDIAYELVSCVDGGPSVIDGGMPDFEMVRANRGLCASLPLHETLPKHRENTCMRR